MQITIAEARGRGHVMKIMDPTGHTTTAWDPAVPAEVTAARAQFELMTGKGYRAFRVGRRGQPAERMETFDPSAEQMILMPQLSGG